VESIIYELSLANGLFVVHTLFSLFNEIQMIRSFTFFIYIGTHGHQDLAYESQQW